MARNTDEESAATRERILDVATHIFSEHGLTQTGMQQIAEGARLTRGAIQCHFGDKDSLVQALMTERVLEPARSALEELEAGMDATLSPLERLEALVIVVLDAIVHRPPARQLAKLTILGMECFDRRDAAYRLKLDCMEDWARRAGRCVAQAQRSKLLPDTVDAGAAGLIMCAMFQGPIRNWLLDPAAFDLCAKGKEMTEVFLNGLRTVRMPLALSASRQAIRYANI